jgi:hypothetical protein
MLSTISTLRSVATALGGKILALGAGLGS